MLVRLNRQEHDKLSELKRQSGLPASTIIRAMIMNKEIKGSSPELLSDLLRQVARIGNNINQLTHLANGSKSLSPETVEQVARMQAELLRSVKRL